MSGFIERENDDLEESKVPPCCKEYGYEYDDIQNRVTDNSSQIHTIQDLESKFSGKDDAESVHLVPLHDILNGKSILAFSHIYFVMKAIERLRNKFSEEFYTAMCQRAQLLFECSIYRNTLIVNAVNNYLKELNEKGNNYLLLTVTPLMSDILANKEGLELRARLLGVDISRYMVLEEDDFESCTNSFCLNQKVNETGKASDNVIIIQNGNGDLYLMTIVRVFGPGRGGYALSGGFREKDEDMCKSAKRELEEEIGGICFLNSLKTVEVIEFAIEEECFNHWDPRAKFPLGMCVGACVKFIELCDILG